MPRFFTLGVLGEVYWSGSIMYLITKPRTRIRHAQHRPQLQVIVVYAVNKWRRLTGCLNLEVLCAVASPVRPSPKRKQNIDMLIMWAMMTVWSADGHGNEFCLGWISATARENKLRNLGPNRRAYCHHDQFDKRGTAPLSFLPQLSFHHLYGV